MNENKAGLGYQNFEEVRTEHIFYIDKTDFIRECFFSNKYAGRSELFEGLSIWEEKSLDGEYRYQRLQGTFPVIFFKFCQCESDNI